MEGIGIKGLNDGLFTERGTSTNDLGRDTPISFALDFQSHETTPGLTAHELHKGGLGSKKMCRLPYYTKSQIISIIQRIKIIAFLLTGKLNFNKVNHQLPTTF